jgi:hypothetical protein
MEATLVIKIFLAVAFSLSIAHQTNALPASSSDFIRLNMSNDEVEYFLDIGSVSVTQEYRTAWYIKNEIHKPGVWRSYIHFSQFICDDDIEGPGIKRMIWVGHAGKMANGELVALNENIDDHRFFTIGKEGGGTDFEHPEVKFMLYVCAIKE